MYIQNVTLALSMLRVRINSRNLDVLIKIFSKNIDGAEADSNEWTVSLEASRDFQLRFSVVPSTIETRQSNDAISFARLDRMTI